ncbi:RNase A-like domain-containing protein [Streptomyces flavochromogenes]|uniref:RNase A-like domain-containing protein n=1 Tax=Streptomyces flavochromogenes TaxID=68199 RepID=A0ABW6XUM0_9ACTN|nr:RNase A-like domain-containing protein [Streptomyces flavochromogenes]
MYQHIKQKIVTLVTVLCLTVVGGAGTAAAAGQAEREPTLLEIAARFSKYSQCGEKPLLERPKCYKEFALTSVKIGVGVGLYLYISQKAMRDGGASFVALNKELRALDSLQPLALLDPDKETDPEKRRQILDQTVKALKASKPHLDRLRGNLVDASRILGDHNDSVLALVLLTLAAPEYHQPPRPLPDYDVEILDIGGFFKDINKALDQTIAGMDQMNAGLDQMNDAMVDVNRGIDQVNKGLNQANKGMKELNKGVAQANKGMDQTKKAVSDFNKAADRLHELPDIDFDFSKIADNIGANGMSPAELAAQERRMSLLLDLLPGIGDGKGILDALTGKDSGTGEQLSTTDRILGSLAMLRWLKTGGKLIPDDIRSARKADDVFACNSFPAGTRVLMADGSHRTIQDVREGDLVLATEAGGDTEPTEPRPVLSVPFTSSLTDKTFVRLTVTAGDGTESSVTSTEGHRYWLPERRSWVSAGTVVAGDRLRTAEGAQVAVTATARFAAHQDTYDLDVSGIDSYYVEIGTEDVLVHNCTDLGRAQRLFPGVAHTLDEHVDVDLQQMKNLAIKKTEKIGRPTPSSRWSSADLAQKAVNQLVDENKARIDKWVRDSGKPGKPQQLTLTGTYGTGSLGDSVDHLGNHTRTTSNRFSVTLAVKQGHKPGGFYVLTAYPL